MNASPVWNLQTNFGGGKTHSMLALYHLLSGTPLAEYPDEVRKVLGGVTLPAARRAVLVGNHIAAGKGSDKPDGTHVSTLWGELAWQLGLAAGGEAEARRAYEMVRDADETRSNPGAALGTLIAAYAPCLILIDEWVAYARQLYGRDDLAGGSFDTQFTFAQTLTEAVKAVPGAQLVVSIPASSADPMEEENADAEPGLRRPHRTWRRCRCRTRKLVALRRHELAGIDFGDFPPHALHVEQPARMMGTLASWEFDRVTSAPYINVNTSTANPPYGYLPADRIRCWASTRSRPLLFRGKGETFTLTFGWANDSVLAYNANRGPGASGTAKTGQRWRRQPHRLRSDGRRHAYLHGHVCRQIGQRGRADDYRSRGQA